MITLGDSRGFLAARDAYMADGTVPPRGVVRSVIFDSWRRSKLYGLDADGVSGVRVREPSPDGQLARAAQSLIERYRTSMSDFASALTLTDEDGAIVEHRVNDPRLARRLEARNMLPGFSLAENAVGTCAAGIALETGTSTLVLGAEHFPSSVSSMASASAAVRHPLTRRLVGIVALTCTIDEASPLMLSWLEDQADKLERYILEAASAREQQLFTTFMSESRDTRHPVICLNDRTVISNAPAARMVAHVDQTVLWELASNSVASGRLGSFEIMLPDSDTPVHVECGPIARAGEVVGATLRLGRSAPAKPAKSPLPVLSAREAEVLAGLAGHSVAWLEFCRRVRRAKESGRPALIIGPPGSGKTSVLNELARGLGTTQRVSINSTDPATQVTAALAGTAPVIVDDLHASAEFGIRELGESLRSTRSAPQVFATALWVDAGDGEQSSADFGVWPGMVIPIPQLKDRVGDLPVLLDTLTRQRVSSGFCPVWTTDAVQALSRVPWSANVASLAKLVSAMIRRNAGPYIRRDDLPAEVLALASRRAVYGLEYFEVQAITSALKASDGNKKLAAEKLGIARSTLYRKVRALGIDLSGSTY